MATHLGLWTLFYTPDKNQVSQNISETMLLSKDDGKKGSN